VDLDIARHRPSADFQGVSTSSVSLGWTTTETREDALKVGQGLVEARLAACIQITGAVTSIYPWKGRIESAKEFRLAIKFPTANADAIAKWLEDNHPYDLPQWVYSRLDGGSEKYLKWVTDNSSYPPFTQVK